MLGVLWKCTDSAVGCYSGSPHIPPASCPWEVPLSWAELGPSWAKEGDNLNQLATKGAWLAQPESSPLHLEDASGVAGQTWGTGVEMCPGVLDP